MDNKDLLLWLTLDKLGSSGISTDIKDFDGRKNVQKSLYLLQEQGLPYGYYFSWYLRGPYSKGLADDYYRVAERQREKYQKGAEGRWLHDDIAGKIKSLHGALDGVAGLLSNNLEAAASARYLVATRQAATVGTALEELRRRKPDLAFDEPRVAKFLSLLPKPAAPSPELFKA